MTASLLRSTPSSRRARERAVDHVDGVVDAIDRHERAEARALLLAEQHLVEHVEPVERDAGLAVLGLLLLVEERLAPADLVDHVLDFLGGGPNPDFSPRIPQSDQRRPRDIAWLPGIFPARRQRAGKKDVKFCLRRPT